MVKSYSLYRETLHSMKFSLKEPTLNLAEDAMSIRHSRKDSDHPSLMRHLLLDHHPRICSKDGSRVQVEH